MIMPWVLVLVGGGAMAIGLASWLRLTPETGREARLARRVWVPLLGIIPGAVAGAGAASSVTSGVVLALIPLLAVPLLLLPAAAGRRADPWDAETGLPLVWPATGVVLLLVAVAGSLPLSGVLVLFTLGAVIAWGQSIPRTGESWGGAGVAQLTLAIAGAAICSAGLRAMPSTALVQGLMLLPCVWAITALVRTKGPAAGIEAAMWSSVLAALLVPGLLGWDTLVDLIRGEQAPLTAAGAPRTPSLVMLVTPGLALLMVSGLLAGFGRWGTTGRWAALVATAGAVLWLAASGL